ncbi:CAP domain-containing protein [Nocardioides dongkuii]|uniref:CAP domain-containing protein n=1 Tax=Nocardioides dongkuii TaxID=2760089 RepID=UPI0015F864BD|nr:CAP domain-containing protein [Nocardioides dongkuii]
MWFMRAAVAAFLVLTLGALVPSASSASDAPTGERRASKVLYAQTAHAATNVVRTVRGLKPLGRIRCLQRMANKQAGAMARRESMFHQDLGPVLRRCRLSTAGENVAYGFSSGTAVVDAWMASPGHRANILKKDYRLMGIAARRSDSGQWFVAQVFGRRA